MKTAAVICEFNPFHNGHKYLIEKIKQSYSDAVVCILSGSFVQRGDISICDKYQKTRAALAGGCDLVIELPTVYAVSNAQCFAQNGVDIAKELKCDFLCFGSENASTDDLKKALNIIESNKAQTLIKENMKSGSYYPKAVQQAVCNVSDKYFSDIIGQANNILGIEYIKAIKETDILPIAINRIGVTHDCSIPNNNIASASYIRELINASESYEKYTPTAVNNPASLKNIESAIMYKLKTMGIDEIKALPDVNEGLENRIFEYSKKYNSYAELLDALKTKRYTLARLRRIVMSALLCITKDIQAIPVPYIRVLGMNNIGAEILKNATTLPLVTKVSSGYKKLDKNAKKIFNVDIKASDIYNLATKNKSYLANDFSAGIIKKH